MSNRRSWLGTEKTELRIRKVGSELRILLTESVEIKEQVVRPAFELLHNSRNRNRIRVIHKQFDRLPSSLHFVSSSLPLFSQFSIEFHEQQSLILNICEKVVFPYEVEYVRTAEA